MQHDYVDLRTDPPLFQAAKETLKAIAEKAVNGAAAIGKGVVEAANHIGDVVSSSVAGVGDFVKDPLGGFKKDHAPERTPEVQVARAQEVEHSPNHISAAELGGLSAPSFTAGGLQQASGRSV